MNEINLIGNVTNDQTVMDIKISIDIFSKWMPNTKRIDLYFALTVKAISLGIYINLSVVRFNCQHICEILDTLWQNIDKNSKDSAIYLKQLSFLKNMVNEYQKSRLKYNNIDVVILNIINANSTFNYV